MTSQLAWIGLGNMGRGMCKNIVEKAKLDNPLILYNRTKSRADDLSLSLGGAFKTKVVGSIADAVAPSDLIFISVGDDAALTQTVDAILATGNLSGKLVVDCSTVAPETEEEQGQRLVDAGLEFVSCPVFGSPAMADTGKVIWIAAGPKTSIEKMLPYGEGVVARAKIVFADEPYGKAQKLKIIGNSMILQMVESVAGGLVMADKSGLGVDHLSEWIGLMWPGAYPMYAERMVQGTYHKRDPLFAIPLARKDARHAIKIAKDNGASVPALEVAAEHLRKVEEEMGDKGDMAGIYGAIRQESGLPFKN